MGTSKNLRCFDFTQRVPAGQQMDSRGDGADGSEDASQHVYNASLWRVQLAPKQHAASHTSPRNTGRLATGTVEAVARNKKQKRLRNSDMAYKMHSKVAA